MRALRTLNAIAWVLTHLSALAVQTAGGKGCATRQACSSALLVPPQWRKPHLWSTIFLVLAGGLLGASSGCVEARATALSDFHKKWEGESLVLLKWISLQVGARFLLCPLASMFRQQLAICRFPRRRCAALHCQILGLSTVAPAHFDYVPCAVLRILTSLSGIRLQMIARLLALPRRRLQASSNVPGNVAHVKALMSHPAFNINNPNSCYSLFLGFARSPVNFHAGAGGCQAEVQWKCRAQRVFFNPLTGTALF